MFKLSSYFAPICVAMAACACSHEPTCNYDKYPYMAANSVAPLQVPPGMSAPDQSAALTIPPVPDGAPAKPSGKMRCLDRPPSYFETDAKSAADKGESRAEKK